MKQIQEQVFQPSPKKSQDMEHPVIESKSSASLELLRLNFSNLRFACPSCGTLDVFVSRREDQQRLRGNCLDCKKTWFEEIN